MPIAHTAVFPTEAPEARHHHPEVQKCVHDMISNIALQSSLSRGYIRGDYGMTRDMKLKDDGKKALRNIVNATKEVTGIPNLKNINTPEPTKIKIVPMNNSIVTEVVGLDGVLRDNKGKELSMTPGAIAARKRRKRERHKREELKREREQTQMNHTANFKSMLAAGGSTDQRGALSIHTLKTPTKMNSPLPSMKTTPGIKTPISVMKQLNTPKLLKPKPSSSHKKKAMAKKKQGETEAVFRRRVDLERKKHEEECMDAELREATNALEYAKEMYAQAEHRAMVSLMSAKKCQEMVNYLNRPLPPKPTTMDILEGKCLPVKINNFPPVREKKFNIPRAAPKEIHERSPLFPIETLKGPEHLMASALPPSFPPSLSFRALSAYTLIRTLSLKLRVSPFSPVAFLRALCLPIPCRLLGDVHVAILRYLFADLGMGRYYLRSEKHLQTRGSLHPRAGDNLFYMDVYTWPLFFEDYATITAEQSIIAEKGDTSFSYDSRRDNMGRKKGKADSDVKVRGRPSKKVPLNVVQAKSSLLPSDDEDDDGDSTESEKDPTDDEDVMPEEEFESDDEDDEDYGTRARKSAKHAPASAPQMAQMQKQRGVNADTDTKHTPYAMPQSISMNTNHATFQNSMLKPGTYPMIPTDAYSPHHPMAPGNLSATGQKKSYPPCEPPHYAIVGSRVQALSVATPMSSVQPVHKSAQPNNRTVVSQPPMGLKQIVPKNEHVKTLAANVGSHAQAMSQQGIHQNNHTQGNGVPPPSFSKTLTSQPSMQPSSTLSPLAPKAYNMMNSHLNNKQAIPNSVKRKRGRPPKGIVEKPPQSQPGRPHPPPQSRPIISNKVRPPQGGQGPYAQLTPYPMYGFNPQAKNHQPPTINTQAPVAVDQQKSTTKLNYIPIKNPSNQMSAEAPHVTNMNPNILPYSHLSQSMPPPKRQRGRPRKNKNSEAPLSSPGQNPIASLSPVLLQPKPVPGKHGKSSKNRVDEASANPGENAVISPMSMQPNSLSAKRGRGRPSRNKTTESQGFNMSQPPNSELQALPVKKELPPSSFINKNINTSNAIPSAPMPSMQNWVRPFLNKDPAILSSKAKPLVNPKGLNTLHPSQVKNRPMGQKEPLPQIMSLSAEINSIVEKFLKTKPSTTKSTNRKPTKPSSEVENNSFLSIAQSLPQLKVVRSLRHGTDYCNLSISSKLTIMEFLLDQLLQVDVFSSELSKRLTLTSNFPGNFGPLPNSEELSNITNVDECVVCGFEGELICCDGCTASYHRPCINLSPEGELPEGKWLCPECRVVDPVKLGPLHGGSKCGLDWFTLPELNECYSGKLGEKCNAREVRKDVPILQELAHPGIPTPGNSTMISTPINHTMLEVKNVPPVLPYGPIRPILDSSNVKPAHQHTNGAHEMPIHAQDNRQFLIIHGFVFVRKNNLANSNVPLPLDQKQLFELLHKLGPVICSKWPWNQIPYDPYRVWEDYSSNKHPVSMTEDTERRVLREMQKYKTDTEYYRKYVELGLTYNPTRYVNLFKQAPLPKMIIQFSSLPVPLYQDTISMDAVYLNRDMSTDVYLAKRSDTLFPIKQYLLQLERQLQRAALIRETWGRNKHLISKLWTSSVQHARSPSRLARLCVQLIDESYARAFHEEWFRLPGYKRRDLPREDPRVHFDITPDFTPNSEKRRRNWERGSYRDALKLVMKEGNHSGVRKVLGRKSKKKDRLSDSGNRRREQAMPAVHAEDLNDLCGTLFKDYTDTRIQSEGNMMEEHNEDDDDMSDEVRNRRRSIRNRKEINYETFFGESNPHSEGSDQNRQIKSTIFEITKEREYRIRQIEKSLREPRGHEIHWPICGRIPFEPHGSLPAPVVRFLGRNAGMRAAPYVHYTKRFEVGQVSVGHVWRQTMKKCANIGELVLQLRFLDSYLQKTTIHHCEGLARRPNSVRRNVGKVIQFSQRDLATGQIEFFVLNKMKKRGCWFSEEKVESSTLILELSQRVESQTDQFFKDVGNKFRADEEGKKKERETEMKKDLAKGHAKESAIAVDTARTGVEQADIQVKQIEQTIEDLQVKLVMYSKASGEAKQLYEEEAMKDQLVKEEAKKREQDDRRRKQEDWMRQQEDKRQELEERRRQQVEWKCQQEDRSRREKEERSSQAAAAREREMMTEFANALDRDFAVRAGMDGGMTRGRGRGKVPGRPQAKPKGSSQIGRAKQLFQTSIAKHEHETKRLLEESAEQGLATVPVVKMNAVRLSSMESMKEANNLLMELDPAEAVSEAELTEILSSAENGGLKLYIRELEGVQSAQEKDIGKGIETGVLNPRDERPEGQSRKKGGNRMGNQSTPEEEQQLPMTSHNYNSGVQQHTENASQAAGLDSYLDSATSQRTSNTANASNVQSPLDMSSFASLPSSMQQQLLSQLSMQDQGSQLPSAGMFGLGDAANHLTDYSSAMQDSHSMQQLQQANQYLQQRIFDQAATSSSQNPGFPSSSYGTPLLGNSLQNQLYSSAAPYSMNPLTSDRGLAAQMSDRELAAQMSERGLAAQLEGSNWNSLHQQLQQQQLQQQQQQHHSNYTGQNYEGLLQSPYAAMHQSDASGINGSAFPSSFANDDIHGGASGNSGGAAGSAGDYSSFPSWYTG